MNQVKTATRRTDARRVPIGWSAVKLGSVCSIQNGFAFEGSRFTPSRGTALIRIRDLKTNAPSVYYDGPIDPAYLVPPGGLLVGMDGEFRCYEWRGPSALLNQRVCRLHADPQRLDAAFLQLALDDYLRAIEEETGFTTVKHLSSRQIGDIQLALPPLPEQRRIAEMLKEQLAAVERARAAAKARLEAAGEVVETQLRDAFDGSEMKHWPRAALEDLAGGPDAFADGPFGSHLKTEHYRPSGVRVIRLQNIGRGTFLDSDRVYVSLDHFAGLERHSVRGGDVVVAALGSGARPAGRACVVPEHLAPALVKADCFPGLLRGPQDLRGPRVGADLDGHAKRLGAARIQLDQEVGSLPTLAGLVVSYCDVAT